MIESIPSAWNEEREVASFGITAALVAEGFTADSSRQASAEFAGVDFAARVEKMLDDLVMAESWESMTVRSATARGHRDLVALTVAAPRRRL